MRRFQAEISKVKLVANFSNMVKLSEGWPQPAVPLHRPKEGPSMPLFALVVAGLAVGFDQLVQWKFGAMGVIAIAVLSIGLKARSTTISGLGALILVMLLAQSG